MDRIGWRRESLLLSTAIYLFQSLPVVGRALGSASAGRPALEIAYRCIEIYTCHGSRVERRPIPRIQRAPAESLQHTLGQQSKGFDHSGIKLIHVPHRNRSSVHVLDVDVRHAKTRLEQRQIERRESAEKLRAPNPRTGTHRNVRLHEYAVAALQYEPLAAIAFPSGHHPIRHELQQIMSAHSVCSSSANGVPWRSLLRTRGGQ